MIFDSHCHLQFKAFDNIRNDVIKKCEKNKIFLINVSTSLETSKKAVELSNKYDFMFSSIGLHPLHIENDFVKHPEDEAEQENLLPEKDFDIEKYKKLAENSKKLVAVGEIGFDLYKKPKTTKKKEQYIKLQEDILLKQIRFAKELNLPIIFHCRMGHKYLIELLKQEKNIKGVIHSFTGDEKELEQYLKMGFYIGVNALIFKLNWLEDIVKKTPIDRILLETDAPYIVPPKESWPNKPSYILHTAQKISELKNVNLEDVLEKTSKNTLELFRIRV